MPRIKPYEEKYLEQDFKKEIFRCLANRYDEVSVRALAREVGVCQSTLNTKLRHSQKSLDIADLQKIVPLLNPDPGIILKLLGFTAAQIKRYKES